MVGSARWRDVLAVLGGEAQLVGAGPRRRRPRRRRRAGCPSRSSARRAGSDLAPTASGLIGMGAPCRSRRSRTCWRWGGPGRPGRATAWPSTSGSSSGVLDRRAAVPALGHRQHAAGHVEHPAGHAGRQRAGQPAHDRRDVLGRHLLLDLVGQLAHAQVLGHAGEGGGGDGVDGDAVAGQLLGGDDREAGDAGLGGAVVGLADVAVDARRRRRVDDAGVDLVAGLRPLAPVVGGEVRGAERALEVDLDDGVPLGLGHVDEHAVAQDAGVVDEHVEPAEGLDGGADQLLGAGRSR